MNQNGNGHVASARAQLDRVVEVLSSHGFYAYIHLDEENRWSVSIDTDEGHADVRLGGGAFVIEAWDTSPGLFWDEDNERRFHAKERRARIILPVIARGIVEPGQSLWWDEQDHGVGARVSEFLPYDSISRLPYEIRGLFDRLNNLLSDAERRILD